MRRARLVGGHVLRGDHRVERGWEAPLGEGDDVAVAVREQGELPTFLAELTQRGPHVAERGPVGNRRDERGRVVRLEVQRQLFGRAARGLGQHRAVSLESPLAFHIRLGGDVSRKERIAVAGEDELARRSDAVAPVDQGAETVERQPAICHDAGS